MGKFVVFKNVDEMPEAAVSRSSMSWNKTGSWRSSTPVHRDLRPPCNHNCPAGENIRGYIDLIKKNKVRDAFDLLTDANPLPAVCGRVCYHPCQSNCNRKDFDTEIQVRLMEKFIGDWGIEEKIRLKLPEKSSKKAAIIGAGPAGIAAAHYLRLKGINVTVYDDGSIPGGILHYGIPSYRLEKDVLKLELDRVLNGVRLKLNSRFGRDFDIGDLINYDSIFLATGAHRSKSMGVEGDSLDGVEPGLAFLRNVSKGRSYDLNGREIIVVGGGNTACDVARSAYRLGARVTLVYRRTEKEMPAFSEEIEQLKSEPIETEFLAAPVRVEKTDDGKLKAVFIRMKLGEPDDSGRARPVAVKGSEFEIIAHRIFSAIGEDPDLSFFPETRKDDEGYFDFTGVDKRIRDKLFIGGDILPNPRTVPHAVGSGRLAAEKIISMFEGKSYDQPDEIVEVAGPEDINYIYFTRINAAKWSERIKPGGRISDVETAVEEANRCFSCGVCYKCDNCFNFCPDMSVVRSADGYHVNLDYCKGCGICAQECPCGSLKMEGGR